MTNRILKILVSIALVSSFGVAKAQTDVNLDTEFGGRLSFTLDKKIARGLHLSLEEELRMADNFKSFERSHTTLGVSYKVNDHLKVGAGYALINKWDSDSSSFMSPRHRLMVDATGSIRLGDWRLSLKERFQATYRSGDINEYQAPRTALTLKSRLKVQYKGFRRIEPYASAEMRNIFNAHVVNATYNETTGKWGYIDEDGDFSKKGDAGWFLKDGSKAYVNRIRFALGAEYRIDKRSSVEATIMADRIMDYVIDANSEGTKLKSYTHEKGFVVWLTAGYRYSF